MFQNKLSELRKSKGYNMKQTAAKLGIPYTTYVSYERGDREPDSERLIQLSDFFDCSIDCLIGRSTERGEPIQMDAETNRAIEIGKRIHDRRIELHRTQEEIGAAVGMNKSTVQRYETGQVRRIKLPVLEALADYLGVSAGWLAGKNENTEPNAIILPEKKIRMVPVFESVSAGMGAYADDNIVDYMPCFIQNEREAENTICVNVCGNSMYPKIEDGDIIQVLKQDWAESGQIAVVLIDGEEAVVKKIEYTANTVTLISINPEWAPRTFTGADRGRLKILGVVKKVIKDV